MHMMARAAWGLTLFGAVALQSCGSTSSVSGPDSSAGAPNVIVHGNDPPADPPDGEAACPPGACNYQSGAGCDAGFGCRPQFTASSTDVSPGCETAGSGVTGSACQAQADCAAGYLRREQLPQAMLRG